MKSRYMFYVAVHAFMVREGKILLLKRKNTGYRDGEYSVPAGHLDGGETIAAAMKRELLEEVGISLPADPSVCHVMHRTMKDEERIDYFFLISSWSGKAINAEPQKCEEISWHALDNLPSLTIPYVREALSLSFQDKLFSEFVETDSNRP